VKNTAAGSRQQHYPSAQEISRALGGHRAGKGFVARCPAHDDHCPSLSIIDGYTGRPVFFCHAGCDFRDVLNRLTELHLWPRFEEACR
jgi:hypothetical protein